MLATAPCLLLRAGKHLAMIRLGPPGKRGQQVVLDRADVEFDQMRRRGSA